MWSKFCSWRERPVLPVITTPDCAEENQGREGEGKDVDEKPRPPEEDQRLEDKEDPVRGNDQGDRGNQLAVE